MSATVSDLFDVPTAPPTAGKRSYNRHKPGERRASNSHICIYLPPAVIEDVKKMAEKFGYPSVSEYARAALTKFRQLCQND